MTLPINRIINKLPDYPIEDVIKLQQAIESYLQTPQLPARITAAPGKLNHREGYRQGLDVAFAQCELAVTSVQVAESLSRVADVVLSTESLPSDFQSVQLRNFYTAYGKHHEMDKFILSNVYRLKKAMRDAEQFKSMGGIYKIERDDSKRVISIALKFVDGLNNLTTDINPDGGASLRAAVLEFGADPVRDISAKMAANAKRLGKTSQQEEWMLQLRDRWQEVERANPDDIKPSEVRHKLLKEIGKWVNGKWIKPAIGEISEAESRMFDSLMTQKAKNDAITYRKWLIN